VNQKDRDVCELENVRILLYDSKIEDLNDLVNPLEHFIQTETPVVIIAEDIVGEALSSLVLNKNRDVLKVCAIKAPSFGERRNDYMEDLAVLTGATFVTASLGLTLRDVTPEMFGKAKKITVAKDRSMFISTGEFTEEAEKRMEFLKGQMKDMDSEYDLEKYEERVARLGGAIGRIRVGGATETILRDKKLRYEDAINSCKQAMSLGVLPGGGTVFVYLQRFKDEVRAMFENEEIAYGVDLLFEAIEAPIHVLATNCGEQGELIYQEVIGKEFGYGWNAETEKFGDLFEMGVLDPASVTIESLRSAVSVASCVITCGGLITDIPFAKLDMLGELEADEDQDMDSEAASDLLKKLNLPYNFEEDDDEDEGIDAQLLEEYQQMEDSAAA
jgi:chaperonin GroEL